MLVELSEDNRFPFLLSLIEDAIRFTYGGMTTPSPHSGKAQAVLTDAATPNSQHYAMVRKDIAALFYWEKVSEILKSIGEDIARCELQETEAVEHGNN